MYVTSGLASDAFDGQSGMHMTASMAYICSVRCGSYYSIEVPYKLY